VSNTFTDLSVRVPSAGTIRVCIMRRPRNGASKGDEGACGESNWCLHRPTDQWGVSIVLWVPTPFKNNWRSPWGQENYCEGEIRWYQPEAWQERVDRHHGPINGPTDIHTGDGWWILSTDTLKTWFGLDEALTCIPCRYHNNLVRFRWSLNMHTLPIPPRLGSVWMKP